MSSDGPFPSSDPNASVFSATAPTLKYSLDLLSVAPRTALRTPHSTAISPAPCVLHPALPAYPPFPQEFPDTLTDHRLPAQLRLPPFPESSPRLRSLLASAPSTDTPPTLPLTLLPSARASAGSPGAKHLVLNHTALRPRAIMPSCPCLYLHRGSPSPPSVFLHVSLPSPIFMSVHLTMGSVLFAPTSSCDSPLSAGGSPHPQTRFEALSFSLQN